MSKYTTRAFSYDLMTPNMLEGYEKLQEDLFVSFTRFFKANKWDVDMAYRQWWQWYGPMSFYKTEDSLRFKKELYSYIIGKFEQLMEAPSDDRPLADSADSN